VEAHTQGNPISLGLYVHFPFCIRKCRYCDFFSVPADDKELVEKYVSTLCAEARARGRGGSVDTVFLGGGTPSLLSLPQVERLLASLRAGWRIDSDAEVSMEANPETITAGKLRDLREAGVTRLSIGVQSFDDSRLGYLGRVHTAQRARDAVAGACGAGFDCVGVDLMFGLPGQAVAEFRADLEEALRFPLGHLSCYELSLEAGTPLAREGPSLPAEDAVISQWGEAERAARGAGMHHYEISNYCLPGRECRHNLKYWRDEDFVGLGAGAYSSLNGERSANARDIKAYLSAESSGFPSAETDRLGGKRKMGETLMLNLRLSEGCRVAEFERRYGEGAIRVFMPALEKHAAAGLVELGEERIRLTPKGRLLANEVWADLLEPVDSA